MSDRTLTGSKQNTDGTPPVEQQPVDERLCHAIVRMQVATELMINGDDTLWNELCSQGEDVTVVPGVGVITIGAGRRPDPATTGPRRESPMATPVTTWPQW